MNRLIATVIGLTICAGTALFAQSFDVRTGTHFEATSQAALRVNVSNKTGAGVSTMTITGKWLNARCTD